MASQTSERVTKRDIRTLFMPLIILFQSVVFLTALAWVERSLRRAVVEYVNLRLRLHHADHPDDQR